MSHRSPKGELTNLFRCQEPGATIERRSLMLGHERHDCLRALVRQIVEAAATLTRHIGHALASCTD